MHRASKVMADGLVDHATPQAGVRAAHAEKSGHASAVGDDRAVVIKQAGLEIDGLIGQLDLRPVQRAVAGWTIVGLADLDDAFVAQVAETAKEGIAKGWGHDGSPEAQRPPRTGGDLLGRDGLSDPVIFGERKRGAFADDGVVQDAHLNQGQGLGQASCEHPVGGARFRATGRVVMTVMCPVFLCARR